MDRLKELVECESPSSEVALLDTCADLLTAWGDAILGRKARRIVHNGQPHLLWPARDQRILLLGHFDTVWPAGTLAGWPFTVTGGIATGPGVCDMKGGIVQMFEALSRLADPERVGVLLTSDEETGSTTSRALIEREALRSGAVLVLEPSTPAGELKVARRGGALFRLTANGRAAHAGVEPEKGVNATIELAHQVLALQGLSSVATSVTPTVIAGGTGNNVVPESATVNVDVRAWTRAELDRIDRTIRALRPHLAGATLTIGGGVNRYPMEEKTGRGLLETAREVAKELGLPPPEGVHAPGASDGNFTGALGVPTLDGLGSVGGHAHARGEYIEIGPMAERVALLAGLIERSTMEP